MSRRTLVVWVICALTLVVATVSSGIAIATWSVPTLPGFTPRGFAVFLAFVYAIVGALLVSRASSNAIGYVFMAVAMSEAAQGLSEQIAIAAEVWPTLLPIAPMAALLFWVLGIAYWFATALFVIALFPTGRFTKIGDRRAVVVGTLALLLVPLAVFSDVDPLPAPFSRYANPLAQPQLMGMGSRVAVVAAVVYLVALAIVLVGLVQRFRRSRGVERQQLKWFSYAAGIVGSTLALVVVPFLAEYATTARFSLYEAPLTVRAVVAVDVAAFAALPGAIALAILRYRLYDVDLLVKRTVVYGATTATIGAVFFAGIVALQATLRPLTAGSDLAVAAATLLSFGLFQPVRRRVQDRVDRRFDRSRYNAARTLDVFADRLRDEVDLDALRDDLLGAVRQTMGPAHASLWLRERTS